MGRVSEFGGHLVLRVLFIWKEGREGNGKVELELEAIKQKRGGKSREGKSGNCFSGGTLDCFLSLFGASVFREIPPYPPQQQKHDV